MTNAEKYLKDGVRIYDFLVNYAKWYVDKHHRLVVTTPLEDFLRDECKPTLSEDEKVILSNLCNCIIKIGRYDNRICLIDRENLHEELWYLQDGLFPFIQEGEEYKISDLLEE
jgi:hypothetical protein